MLPLSEGPAPGLVFLIKGDAGGGVGSHPPPSSSFWCRFFIMARGRGRSGTPVVAMRASARHLLPPLVGDAGAELAVRGGGRGRGRGRHGARGRGGRSGALIDHKLISLFLQSSLAGQFIRL